MCVCGWVGVCIYDCKFITKPVVHKLQFVDIFQKYMNKNSKHANCYVKPYFYIIT